MKKLTIGLMAASIIFLGGCIKKGDTSKPVIKVNSRIITENMFEKALDQSVNSMLHGREIDFKKPQNKFIYLITKGNAVNDLIVKELIQDEADKRKIKVSDEEVDTTLNDIISRFGGREKLETILEKSKLDENSLKENIRLDLLNKKLVENIIGDKAITDEEVKAFYEENKEKHFKHGEEVRAAHILISASEDDIKDLIKNENPDIKKDELNKKVQAKLSEALTKIKDIQQQLQQDPEKFEELAEQYSDDTATASKGGDLGFFPEKGEMVEEFSKTAFATKPGELSDVVKTQFGYHIIKVLDRKESGITPFDEVAPQIQKYLDSSKKMTALRKLIETSRQSANIVYLEEGYNPENIQKELKDLQDSRKKQVEKTESSEQKTEKTPEKT